MQDILVSFADVEKLVYCFNSFSRRSPRKEIEAIWRNGIVEIYQLRVWFACDVFGKSLFKGELLEVMTTCVSGSSSA